MRSNLQYSWGLLRIAQAYEDRLDYADTDEEREQIMRDWKEEEENLADYFHG